MSKTLDLRTVYPPRMRALAEQVLEEADALAQLRAANGGTDELRSLVGHLEGSGDEVPVILAARILDVDKRVVRKWRDSGVLEGTTGVRAGSLAMVLERVVFLRATFAANPSLRWQLENLRTLEGLADRISEVERGETIEIDLEHLDELFT